MTSHHVIWHGVRRVYSRRLIHYKEFLTVVRETVTGEELQTFVVPVEVPESGLYHHTQNRGGSRRTHCRSNHCLKCCSPGHYLSILHRTLFSKGLVSWSLVVSTSVGISTKSVLLFTSLLSLHRLTPILHRISMLRFDFWVQKGRNNRKNFLKTTCQDGVFNWTLHRL